MSTHGSANLKKRQTGIPHVLHSMRFESHAVNAGSSRNPALEDNYKEKTEM